MLIVLKASDQFPKCSIEFFAALKRMLYLDFNRIFRNCFDAEVITRSFCFSAPSCRKIDMRVKPTEGLPGERMGGYVRGYICLIVVSEVAATTAHIAIILGISYGSKTRSH